MSTSQAVLAQLAQEAPSTGETWTFALIAPVAVIGAVGMVVARNAVHSALWLVLTMLSLGVFYVLQSAPFLGLVQVIVYTRSEEHTSELQSRENLVCRLLLEK